MTSYEFVAPTLERLDELESDLIVVPFFSDEQPLRGAGGLLDWRLCGSLSRKRMAGYLDGAAGERAWVIAPEQIKSAGVLLIGLGQSTAFDVPAARLACSQIAEALSNAKVAAAALVLPGRGTGRLSSVDAMQVWLEHAPSNTLEEVTIIEPAEEHRALESLLDGLRRQAESTLA